MKKNETKGYGYFRKKKWCKGLASGIVLLGATVLGTGQFVSADEWTANSPDSIQIETGATSYQLKKGDTL